MVTPTQAKEMSAIDATYLAQLEKDIDRQLCNCFKTGNTVPIPLDGHPQKVIDAIVALYSPEWTVTVNGFVLSFSEL